MRLTTPLRELNLGESNNEITASKKRKWSMLYQWSDRAADYDAEQHRLSLKAAERARIEMAERQILLGQNLQGTARLALRRLFDEQGNLRHDLTQREVARLADVGVKIERLARGEPTENVREEHSGEVQVVRLPVRSTTAEEWAASVASETTGG